MNNQNQYPIFNNPNEQLTYNQIENSNNIYSPKEEEIKIEINTAIRLGFIRKVYGILSFQLLLTTISCIIAMISSSAKLFFVSHKGVLLLTCFLVLSISLIVSCFPNLFRIVPLNYILLLIFTLAESYLVACLCAFSKPEIVFMAATMTFVMVFALTLYAINTQTDFTIKGGLLFILSAAVLLLIIFSCFVRNRLIDVIISLICVVLFSFYLIYDTQLIIGKKQDLYQVDDYILGALNLYVDIIGIFINLLDLFNYANN